MAASLVFEDSGLLVARATGVVMRQEFDRLKQQLVSELQRHTGQIPALIVLEEGFAGLESLAEWDDTAADDIIQPRIKCLAIVGPEQWAEGARLFFLQGLLPFPIHYFKPAEEELAHAWLLG